MLIISRLFRVSVKYRVFLAIAPEDFQQKGNGNGQYSDTYLPESELNAVVARITNPVLGPDYAAYAKLDSLRRDSI
jgi:hypothetical protein